MAEFQKIRTKKKSTYAAEQVVEAIRRGVYGVGDKLPSEREIAEQMGVSRPSVREALSALQIVGIVESRPGDGTYVVRRVTSLEEEARALTLLEESESLEEAFEARRVLEESIVRLACQKALPEDLHAVDRFLAEMRQAAEAHDFERFITANQGFHQAIAAATRNALLLRSLEPLLEVMHQQLPHQLREVFYREDSRRFEETYEIHAAVREAIVRRDAERAMREMTRHFDVLEKDLRD